MDLWGCVMSTYWIDRESTRITTLVLCLAWIAGPASAGWKLIDEGACENPIISLSDGQEPLQENCTPAMAGKGALCYTEVCQPHCLYFNHSLEQCAHGADMGKRYVCDPD